MLINHRKKNADSNSNDKKWMARAIELARNGLGLVEPNPMVGAVVVRDERLVGEGWHNRFGGPHAEVNALASAGPKANGATMYVTLEPCCHHGKTGPCTHALISAGIRRVVVALKDPFPLVSGGGMTKLAQAGIEVDAGCQNDMALSLARPYLCLQQKGRPWVIGKWAMSMDGKIATRSGSSQWISCKQSRQLVHRWRGQVDGILVGSGTVLADNPLLTARPEGARVPTRVVLDRRGRLPIDCHLVRTAKEAPVLVVTSPANESSWISTLTKAGVEFFFLEPAAEPSKTNLLPLLQEMGKRHWTNLMVEGGGDVLGAFFDSGLIDETRVFLAPLVIGGASADSPIKGRGINAICDAWQGSFSQFQKVGTDIIFHSIRKAPAMGMDNFGN